MYKNIFVCEYANVLMCQYANTSICTHESARTHIYGCVRSWQIGRDTIFTEFRGL